MMYYRFQTIKINYTLRSQTDFASNRVNTNKFGLCLPRYFASKVWKMIPLEIKDPGKVEILQTKIRIWEHKGCYCSLCKTIINNLGLANVIKIL